MTFVYRKSRYLNIIPLSGGGSALLFNGVNGCIDEIPNELAEILAADGYERLNGLTKPNLELLSRRGHITTLTPAEELERFKEFTAGLHNQQLKRISSGGIILLASYNCNLACKYCFQQEHRPGHPKEIMPLRLVDDIFKKHLPKLLPGISNPCLSIYGGEPFLPANEAVMRRALDHAKKIPGMSVVAVTNGTTVDAMLDIFGPGPGKVNKAQISLDGGRELHDKSRVTPQGHPTFDKILQNIRLLLDLGVSIDLRVNVDRAKLETLPGLLKELKAKGIAGNPHVYIYAYPLHGSIAGLEDQDFIGLGDVSRKITELGLQMECPSTLKTTDIRRLFSLAHGTGLTRTAYCMQTYQHYLVVDPFGDLYACSEEAGYPEFRVGHISDNGVEFFPLRDTYKRRHLSNLPECLACPVALACGGQCGTKCRAKTGDLFKVYCDDIKAVILNSIKLEYETKNLKTGGAKTIQRHK